MLSLFHKVSLSLTIIVFIACGNKDSHLFTKLDKDETNIKFQNALFEKFGHYSANHGILMSCDGRGNFRYVPQTESGLNIRENVRSLQPILMGKNVERSAGLMTPRWK